MFQEIYLLITFAEAQAIWLVGDDILQRAYWDLITNYDHLQYLSKFKFLETSLSCVMTMQQAAWAVLDLLMANKYVPSVIVIHVGTLDFCTLPNHLISHTTTQMLNTIKNILRKAQPFPHMHLGMFVLHMLPMLWHCRWDSQQARRSRSHFNGHLAQAAASPGCYIIPHPELSLQNHPAFLLPGSQNLSLVGNFIFLADVQVAICKQDPQFILPRQFQLLQECHPNTTKKSDHQ